jgi:DNA-binding NtrC family response regulator
MIVDSSIDYFLETKSKKDLFFHQKNNNKRRIILVDDDQDILLTYESFLKDNDYEIISFTDPIDALNFIKDLPNFNDLLITLDIRMNDMNGIQLRQQIKSIDLTIKILFVTILDISDEILTIVPGLSKDQIIRKPIGKKLFTNTVNKFLN